MIKRGRFPRVFLGWWTVLVGGIMTGLGGAFYHFGISVFFKPISSELGFSRAVTSVAVGIGRMEGGMEAPLTGWLCDKYGPKWVIFAGACITAAGLALMYFINSLWSYILVWGIIIGFGYNIGLTIANDKAITNWFIKKRGLALGVRFLIVGILGVISLPIVTWLVTTQGWRMTNVIWAVVMFAVTPLLLLSVKQKRPEYYGLLPDGAGIEPGSEVNVGAMINKGVEYAAGFQEREFTLRQAVRTRAYWMLLIGWSCGMVIMGAINVHIIPFLTDLGIDPLLASGMMSLMVFFTVPSRFLGGFLADHVRKERLNFLLAGTFLFMAAAIAAFLLKQTMAMIYVFLILYGFGSGASVPLRLTINGRYFGRKAYASILGSIMLLEAPLGFLAPVYAGWIYDTTNSYITALTTFVVLAIVAAVLMCLVRPPKAPTEITDIQKFI